MARIQGIPPLHIHVPRTANMNMNKIVESRVNLGMITSIDSADIPNGALTLAKNVIVRDDVTRRRPGSSLLTPTKPDNGSVTKIAFIKLDDGAAYTLRMTPTKIYIRGGTSWRNVTITPPLAGNVNDRFNTANILNKFIFTNNGANPIQLINFTTSTCAPLGDAPNYRYVVGFYNRAVGLARKDEAETEVGWSKDGDPTIWNPLTHPTAGSSPIVDSPDDLSDFIKGAVSLTNAMFVLREKSVFLATKQPIPTNPFYFYPAVPGIGGDCSYSIQVVKGGICWVDTRTEEIYFYQPGNTPNPISGPNKRAIFNDIDSPETVFSSFATKPDEYSIYIPKITGLTKIWTFNFSSKSWTQGEMVGVTGAANVELVNAEITIDELEGTIDELDGTIDELSAGGNISVPFSYGRDDGSIILEDIIEDSDAPYGGGNVQAFDSVWQSKTIVIPDTNENIAQVSVEYRASRTGDLILAYSKNDGKTWIVSKTVTIVKFNEPVLLIHRRMIKARRFMWQITTNASDVEVLGYSVSAYPAGQSNIGE